MDHEGVVRLKRRKRQAGEETNAMSEARREVPLLLRGEEAAQLLGMGRSKTLAMMATGQLPGVIRIGRSIRISREALERWVREQAEEQRDGAPEANLRQAA